jgi:hypothetical protein
MLVLEHAAPTIFARIGAIWVLNRSHVREFIASGLDPTGAPEVGAGRMRTQARPLWLRLGFLFSLAPFQETDTNLIPVDAG